MWRIPQTRVFPRMFCKNDVGWFQWLLRTTRVAQQRVAACMRLVQSSGLPKPFLQATVQQSDQSLGCAVDGQDRDWSQWTLNLQFQDWHHQQLPVDFIRNVRQRKHWHLQFERIDPTHVQSRLEIKQKCNPTWGICQLKLQKCKQSFHKSICVWLFS